MRGSSPTSRAAWARRCRASRSGRFGAKSCWLRVAGEMPVVGVLALQGDFREHIQVLEALGAHARPVRLPRDLEGLDALVIPGGESTTMRRLLAAYELLEPVRELAGEGKPI